MTHPKGPHVARTALSVVLERPQPSPAGNAVVHVLPGQLLEWAAAEAQGLDGPCEVRGRGRQRQDLAHDLELLAALAVDVDPAWLDLADDLAVRAGSQAVSLIGAHERGTLPSAAGANTGLPRLPAARHGQQHLQRLARESA